MRRVHIPKGTTKTETHPIGIPTLEDKVIGDFSGDGMPDFAVANLLSRDVSVLVANGSATFEKPLTIATGQFPSVLAACDFDGDGTLDLAVANFTDSNVSVFQGNGDGTFGPPISYSTSEIQRTLP